jgi:hypothetical protein
VVGKDDGGSLERVLAHNGTLLLAAGVGYAIDLADGDWLVQAYDGTTGELLWEDLHDGGSGPEAPLDLALFDGRLFVAGRAVDTTHTWDCTVRTYDTGDDEHEEGDD